MRFLPIVGLMGISLAIIWPRFLCAQTSPVSDWQKVRAHQIALVHLKMILAKKEFYQGEKIEATLEFSNDDPDTYSHDYSLEPNSVVFHAKDSLGHDLVDPLWKSNDWRFLFLSSFSTFTIWPQGHHYTLTQTVNDNVRFDQPGVYTLYAQGNVNTQYYSPKGEMIPLVSDPVTITVVPLPPKKERQIIAAAIQKIGPLDSPTYPNAATQKAIAELNYLQTPSARDELIVLLGHPLLAPIAINGLLAAPAPSTEAEHMLAAVRAGKLVLDADGVCFYARLKLCKLTQGHSPQDFPAQEREMLFEKVLKEGDLARQEITTAMLQATAGQVPAHIEALWTAFEVIARLKMPGDEDSDGGIARAAVIAHQLELSDKAINKLLANWPAYGIDGFLPLVRREAKSRRDNPNALIALCKLSPDEARPLVLAEMVRPGSLFFNPPYQAASKLASIPPMPLPELDSFFRPKLLSAKDNGGLMIPIICAFGSANLLPEVLAFSHDHDTQWGNERSSDFHLYWLRCDPKDGATAFGQFVAQSGGSSLNFFLGPDLLASWTDRALPAVRSVVSSADVQSALMAFLLLERHGDDTDVDPMIASLERLGSHENFAALAFPAKYALQLLKSKRWHFTDEQRKRLEALASIAPDE